MMDRAQIEAAGYVPGWPPFVRDGWRYVPSGPAPEVEVGDKAVAYGTGQWREGIVVKVTPTFVFVQYTAPSSGRVWVAKGRRDGQATDLYVQCPTCKRMQAAGQTGPAHRASPRCESGKRPHCSCDVCF